MLEILFLILAASGIAAFARARGGNPWLWGAVALSGYVALAYVLPRLVRLANDPGDAYMLSLGSALAWVGVVAFCARFLPGRTRAKPSSMWTCPNCKYLNQKYAVLCEACQQPFGQSAARTN